jgi:ankyrin repeat protein
MDEIEQKWLNRRFIAFVGKSDIPEMKLLLERGADINAVDEKGYNALMHAVILGMPAVAEFLVKEGIALETKGGAIAYGETALLMAAAKKRPDMVRLLLEAGADINAQNDHGHTSVAHAVDDPPTLAVLLERGADVNLPNNAGITPLMHVTLQMKSAGDTCKMLLARKPELEARDDEGNTAVHYAAASWCWNESLPLLLEAGGDINARNDYGHTPLMHAISFSKTRAAKFLIEAGASLDDRGKDGCTAFAHAVGTFSKDTMRQLSDAGASLDVPDSIMDEMENTAGRDIIALIDNLKKERLEKELSVYKNGLSRTIKAPRPLKPKGPRP